MDSFTLAVLVAAVLVIVIFGIMFVFDKESPGSASTSKSDGKR